VNLFPFVPDSAELIESHLTNNVAVSGGAVLNGGLGDCDPSHDCFYLIVLNTTMDGNRWEVAC
jgi:hypothetical protein